MFRNVYIALHRVEWYWNYRHRRLVLFEDKDN